MNPKPALLVFTDLDGTLLDHHTYDWSPAIPALERLKSIGAGLILASSKTAAEIAELRTALQMQQWPAIVENGAGLLPAHSNTVRDDSQYKKLRNTINSFNTGFRQHFTGFGDMTDAEVADITGLSLHGATLARQRAFSEPGLWNGNSGGKAAFTDQLKEHGISVQQGGRFMTLSYGDNKADKLRQLTTQYQPQKTIALGDAPNDIDMLQAADVGVVVYNPDTTPLPALAGEQEGRIIRTKDSGPTGWNATMLHLLSTYH